MAVVDDVILALQNLNGSGSLSQIYEEYEKVTGNLVKSTVRRTLQQFSSDTTTFSNKADHFFSVNGIGNGVWGLRNYIIEAETDDFINPGSETPGRTEILSKRIIRDTALAQQIKALVGYQCQICDTKIKLKDGQYYCEAHHILPLGKPHNGPDIKENILVVCPNCHVKCDHASIPLSLDTILNNAQSIREEFIEHHNKRYKL